MTTNNDKLGQNVGVRLSDEEVTKLDELARCDGRTRSGYIRKVLMNHINEVKA